MSYLIKCPDASLSKSERVEELRKSIERWIYSEPLQCLIEMFGGRVLRKNNKRATTEIITEIEGFAEVWNYRKGKERWAVQDEEFVKKNEDAILECVKELGLRGVVSTDKEPDYILPLGGARAANKVRPAMARKVMDDMALVNKRIVALSGTRPISAEERPYMTDYAPDAHTEYDAINKGIELVFDVSSYTEEKIENDNINLCAAVRVYSSKYKDSEIVSLAAPSSDPEKRRANSVDTFKFFLERYSVGAGERVLLVTSCIYVPFQSLRFMEDALLHGFEVDCIGADIIDDFSLSKTSNFLQETKATIDAIYGMRHLFE